MPGPNFRLESLYNPRSGTGTIRINFPDLRRSNRKNADRLANAQAARITEDHPGTLVNAELKHGERFAPTWTYAVTTQPAKPAATVSAPTTTT